ncbi:MAG: ATP-binding cassette domain-containing protein, partial [Acetobacterium sp.]|nr:ATP-binding cassette domain-containing protein [Acetobacterium sp.]
MSMVKLVNIRKSFGDLEVLKGVNLEVSQGEVVCIIGASGSGKSTLLRCLNQLERISDGEIYIEDVLSDKRANNKDLMKI